MNEKIVRTANFVVRVSEDPATGELKVKAHRKMLEAEQVPLAYILGVNMLLMKQSIGISTQRAKAQGASHGKGDEKS